METLESIILYPISIAKIALLYVIITVIMAVTAVVALVNRDGAEQILRGLFNRDNE